MFNMRDYLAAKIKSCYLYYDKTYKMYNMFIFLQSRGMAYCIHRINNNLNYLFVENQLFCHQSGSFVYIYEKKINMTDDIDTLKTKYPTLIKIPIVSKLKKIISCFNCMCCNYLIFVLSAAYKAHPYNIIKNGINAEFIGQVMTNPDLPPENLQELINYGKDENDNNGIVKNNEELFSKIIKVIDSGYKIVLQHNTGQYYMSIPKNKSNKIECRIELFGYIFKHYNNNDDFDENIGHTDDDIRNIINQYSVNIYSDN